jgi:hypothetical protein
MYGIIQEYFFAINRCLWQRVTMAKPLISSRASGSRFDALNWQVFTK